jgi:hypothetical protein
VYFVFFPVFFFVFVSVFVFFFVFFPPLFSQVDFAVSLLGEHIQRLRDMSPIWDMVEAGVDMNSIQWTQEH